MGTDSYWAAAPEFAIDPKPDNQSHGIGTIMAIEGLVELGMTPAQAIVAGTKNGAIACRMLNDLGTIEKGKLADLVILDGDPLADIRNIRKVRSVMKEGKAIDLGRLPERRVLSTAPKMGAGSSAHNLDSTFDSIRIIEEALRYTFTIHADAWFRNGSKYVGGLVTGYRVGGMSDGGTARIANFGAPNRNDWQILRINADNTQNDWTGHYESFEDALTAPAARLPLAFPSESKHEEQRT